MATHAPPLLTATSPRTSRAPSRRALVARPGWTSAASAAVATITPSATGAHLRSRQRRSAARSPLLQDGRQPDEEPLVVVRAPVDDAKRGRRAWADDPDDASRGADDAAQGTGAAAASRRGARAAGRQHE